MPGKVTRNHPLLAYHYQINLYVTIITVRRQVFIMLSISWAIVMILVVSDITMYMIVHAV